MWLLGKGLVGGRVREDNGANYNYTIILSCGSLIAFLASYSSYAIYFHVMNL